MYTVTKSRTYWKTTQYGNKYFAVDVNDVRYVVQYNKIKLWCVQKQTQRKINPNNTTKYRRGRVHRITKTNTYEFTRTKQGWKRQQQ